MALSDAEKQRRYRRHRVGDHSLCAPERGCGGAVGGSEPPRKRRGSPPASVVEPEPVPPPAAVRVPGGLSAPTTLGVRGQELWDAMAEVEMGPAHKALLGETCRLLDRLDRFDRVLSGGRWFFDRVSEDNPDQVEIVVDQLVSEARQGASALKVLVAELEPKPSSAAVPKQPKAPSGIASLSERLAQRQQRTVG